MGTRSPVNVSFFPPRYAVPNDADVTAVAYAVLFDNALLDGGQDVALHFETSFSDWRDLGQVPCRNDAEWRHSPSGAFLTWLAYLDDPSHPNLNDVDIVVNANVLYTLGRYGRLNTPGASEAIGLINRTVLVDSYLSKPDQLSLYYPNNLALHYCVTRAYQEGKVKELSPAVERLVRDLLSTVRSNDLGQVFWDRGDPHLNTAFAVISLLNAGYRGRIVDEAISYLLSQQDPQSGAWKPAVFFYGRLNNGTQPIWVSQAFTTAIALEALAKYQISKEVR